MNWINNLISIYDTCTFFIPSNILNYYNLMKIIPIIEIVGNVIIFISYHRVVLWNSDIDFSLFDTMLSKNYINIKNIKYSDLQNYKFTSNYCNICFIEYTFNSNASVLLCDHIFCSKCITKWLNKNPTCPLCRMIQYS
jgi:hypothetical protein